MRHVRDANDRDAEYLACQMYTNSRVLGYQTRMQRARDRLHTIFLEVAELDDAAVGPIFPRAAAEAPLPPIDRTGSAPRTARAISGPILTDKALAQLGVPFAPTSDGVYALSPKPRG